MSTPPPTQTEPPTLGDKNLGTGMAVLLLHGGHIYHILLTKLDSKPEMIQSESNLTGVSHQPVLGQFNI